MRKNWQTVELQDIALVERGKFSVRPRNDPKYFGGDIPFLQTGDVAGASGATISTYSQTLNGEGLKVSKFFPAGTLLITIAANIGDVAEVGFGFACTDSLVAVQPKEGVDKNWLKFFLQTQKSYFESRATQNAQANINLQTIRPLLVELSPLPEQTAIASLLSIWDLAIEKTERLIAAKEKQFTSLVKSQIADKCDGWDHLRADKIFKSISEKQNDNEELLSVTQDRGVIPRSMLEGRVMSPESGTDTYKLIKVGDFAISLRSFQGGIEYSRYQGLISPAYTVLRSKLEIDDDFYRHFFKSYLFIEKYLSIAVIGIRDGKQISIPDFMTVKIPLPPIEEQKQIAAILTTARQEIDLLKKQADTYRMQKRGLMQRLLTGEWRVRVG